MNKFVNFIVLVLFFHSSCTKIISHKIEGKWKMSLNQIFEGKSFVNECVDVISFEKNGLYAIYNDCYSNDPQNPLIEKGKWKINKNNNKIIFTERCFFTNYAFKNTNAKLIFFVKKVNNDELILSFEESDDKNNEIYKKML